MGKYVFCSLVFWLFASVAFGEPQLVENGYEIEIFAANLTEPVGIDFDSMGNFYVGTGGFSDYAARSIARINLDGTIEQFGLPFYNPAPIVIDSYDNVYVGSYRFGLIRILPNGTTTIFVGQFVYIDGVLTYVLDDVDGLALGQDNTIYATDGLDRLYRIDQTGTVQILLELPSRPSGVALDDDGMFYLAMRKAGTVLQWNPITDTLTTIASGLGTVNYVEVEPNSGDVFATAIERDDSENIINSLIYRILLDGQVSLFAQGFAWAQDMVFKDNCMYVTDMISGCIYKISGFEEEIAVLIDIKPGSFPNSINVNQKGVIPVAILTTEDFDATTVDPLSVKFGPNEATEVHQKGHIEDVDQDGDLDMMLHFENLDTGIKDGDTSACLTGETIDGRKIKGCDSIVTVPQKKPKFAALAAFPSPGNPEIWMPYALGSDSEVTIRIYNMSGYLIRTLNLGYKPAGYYDSKDKAAHWDGRNEAGEEVASGIYFYSLEVGDFVAIKKFIIMR